MCDYPVYCHSARKWWMASYLRCVGEEWGLKSPHCEPNSYSCGVRAASRLTKHVSNLLLKHGGS
eukprot:4910493-Prorocentrum_lima.AAC.1